MTEHREGVRVFRRQDVTGRRYVVHGIEAKRADPKLTGACVAVATDGPLYLRVAEARELADALRAQADDTEHRWGERVNGD